MFMQKLRNRMRLPARSERGMTLIEIMIVLTIMAAVMAGVMVSINSGRQRTNVNRTKMAANEIMTYVTMEREADRHAQPSLESLGLSESQMEDAWGNKFQIQYSGNTIKVVSGGPDGSIGGEDDIVVSNE